MEQNKAEEKGINTKQRIAERQKADRTKETEVEEMNALKFSILVMFASGKCCAIVAFFSPVKS